MDSPEETLPQCLHLPTSRSANVACCCGKPTCVYLVHNNAILCDLEKDVRTAAQLGQALLTRHEAYIAEAEQSRQEMGRRIENLEGDKKSLEEENAREIQENRKLLDDLEELNGALSDSQNHIKSLEAILQSTQQELHRFEGFAQRTQDLEVQIAVLEQEQAILQRTVATSEVEERVAIQRWKSAEQALLEVQEQLEKIEHEAMEERNRHTEVVQRMERLRAVEKELENAAGRLKGAAAAKSLERDKMGSSVVSHFVKDILQDNANLQLGIIELRDMLMNSNEEVQSLREQLTLHHPLQDGNSQANEQPSLEVELAKKEPNAMPQEVHIHHHYHAPAKRVETYRPKKRRHTTMNQAPFASSSGVQSPRPPRSPSMGPVARSTAVAILSQTSTTVPRPVTPINRWSRQSVQTLSDLSSSAPSSPQSAFRHSTIFDRGHADQAFDISQPTSPGSSIDQPSPVSKPLHPKSGSELSIHHTSLRPEDVIHEEHDKDVVEVPDLHLNTIQDSTVIHQDEKTLNSVDAREEIEPQVLYSNFAFQPTIRRSVSHESVLSIAGLDVHGLMSSPAQAAISGTSPMLRPGSRLGYNNNQPIISSSSIVARPTLSRRTRDSSSYLRSSVGISDRSVARSASGFEGGASLSKKIGGWMWGRWGITPTPSPLHTGGGGDGTPNEPNADQRPPPKPVEDLARPPTVPSTGSNQESLIQGLRKLEKAPS